MRILESLQEKIYRNHYNKIHNLNYHLYTYCVSADRTMQNKGFPIFGKIDNLILEMRPKSFILRNELRDKITFGFTAQDIEAIFKKYGLNPEKYSILKKDSSGCYALNYEEFIPLLTHVCQTHEMRINNLETAMSQITI